MSVAGWTPTALLWRDGRPRVELRDLRGVPRGDPFFEQTVERAIREPYRLLFGREIDVEELSVDRGLRPSGFVFHGSRCGSTLVASMLGALEDSLVISEAAVVDQILRAPASAGQRADWLRWVLAALAQPENGARRLLVKFDSWSVHDLPVVRAAFPDVPWIFVYRRPDEVLRSQLRLRGMQMVPGVLDPSLFGLQAARLESLPPEEYCARVLAAIYHQAASHLDGHGRLVSYADLPDPGIEDVLGHFGIACTPRERSRMSSVARLEAKNPRLFFDPSRPSVPPAARAAAQRWVAAAYERLEELHRPGSGAPTAC